jgi:sugar lactone lactonase YvrE
MMTVRCVAVCGDQLGEGPCWAAAEGRLFWFDIQGRRLHWLEPGSGRKGEWPLPLRASAAAPRAAGGLLAATEGGLVHINGRTGELRMAQAFTFERGFRSNDGKIDPLGRFWWSTMDDDAGTRPGKIFCTDPNGRTRNVLEGIHIANTLAVTADGGTLFLADSKKQVLRAYRIGANGRPTAPRILADLTGEPGTPDGGAMDAEGFLWNAQWGAWRVVRYAPDGRVDRIIEMPVEQPTSCAFGGPDLATLYITSASDGLDAQALARQPLAGALFALEPGVRGLPLPAFAH